MPPVKVQAHSQNQSAKTQERAGLSDFIPESSPQISWTDAALDPAALSAEQIRRMAAAGRSFMECRRQLSANGRTIFSELSDRRLYPFDHYPKGDVYDAVTHSQFYFHTHRDGEHGHFHTFLRPKGMPPHILPADPADREPAGGNNAVSHLIAISVTADGQPDYLFTTNRWVTAETWYHAADVQAMVPHFHISHDRPSALLNRWVSDLVALFAPQICRLLIERDATIARLSHRLPGIPVLEDRDVEITSRMMIDPSAQIAQILELM